MPEAPRVYYYTSPLKRFGVGLGVGTYALNLALGLGYFVYVYPVQALLGHSHVETVMPWLMLPIVGPWFAQYEDSVRDKPGWRGVLIADAALQAGCLVIGVIGALLSGPRVRAPERAAGFELRAGPSGVTLRWQL